MRANGETTGNKVRESGPQAEPWKLAAVDDRVVERTDDLVQVIPLMCTNKCVHCHVREKTITARHRISSGKEKAQQKRPIGRGIWGMIATGSISSSQKSAAGFAAGQRLLAPCPRRFPIRLVLNAEKVGARQSPAKKKASQPGHA